METRPLPALTLAEFLGGWETILILSVILILFGAGALQGSLRSRTREDNLAMTWKRLSSDTIVWIAQGFGAGRLPFAPGLFGSLVGLLWFGLLLLTGNLWLYLAGTLFGLATSVWLCGLAEKILKQTDPSSVVLDEITALPICFLPWLITDWLRGHQLPPLESFFTERTWGPTLIIFILFRLFDVLKPWPVRQSQTLPGGWGVTVDDVLAASYVALITLLFVH